MARLPFSNKNYFHSGTTLVDGTNLSTFGTLTATGGASSPTRQQDSDGYLLNYLTADPGASQYVGVRCDFTTPQDWSAIEKLGLTVMFPEGVNGDTFQCYTYVGLFIKFDAGGTYTNYLRLNVYPAGAVKMYLETFMAYLAESYGQFTVTGTPALAAVQGFEIRMYRTNILGGPNTMKFVGLYANPRTTPIVTFSWDNAYVSQYTEVFSRFYPYGWKSTIFPMRTEIDQDANHLSTAQINEMYDAGWDVGGHIHDPPPVINITTITNSGTTATATTTQNHNFSSGETHYIGGSSVTEYNGNFVITVTGATTFTYTMQSTPPASAWGKMTVRTANYDTFLSDVAVTMGVLESNGWTRGNDMFAFGYSYYDLNLINMMASAGFRVARNADLTVSTPAWHDRLCSTYHGLDSLSRNNGIMGAIPIAGLADTGLTTAALILAVVDRAIQYGGQALHLYGHGIQNGGGSTYFDTTEFNSLCVGLRERELLGSVRVLSYGQLLDGMTQERLTIPRAT